MFLLFLCLFSKPASHKKVVHKAPPCLATRQQLVLDVDTNEIVQSVGAQELMAPSSMTKILTVLYTLELIKQGKVSLDEIVTVPKEAYKTEGSSMFLEVGQRLTVRELLDGIAVVSANDACRTLAIHICGDEVVFAANMTAFAKKIGAKHTNFVNSSGLPDPQHQTTPYDLAIISLYLLNNHQGPLDRFAQQEFTYNNIHQYNKNVVLGRSSSVFVCDGLKTGHTAKAGYGIVVTARHTKTNRRILCVLNGLHSEGERKRECIQVLEWAFKNTEQKIIHKAGESIAKLLVRFGDIDVVDIVPKKNVGCVRVGNANPEVQVTIQLPKFLKGPLPAGTKVGQVILCINKKSKKIPLVTATTVKPAHFLKKLWHKMRYLK
jgi:D-alanyl-D-alanine carboxypeptidase (penicillin-binding protein 5/6)